jgi:hypothetical protein
MASLFPNPDGQFNRTTAVLAGQKGGKAGLGTHSKTRSISHKIRWLQTKGLTDENAEIMHSFFTNRELAASDIYVLIQKLKTLSNSPKDMNMLIQRNIELAEFLHGKRIKTENISVDITQTPLTDEKKSDIIKRLLNENNTTRPSEDNTKDEE